MITSWKEFLIAVEQMRECQKVYSRTNSPTARHTAQKCEAEVDACIQEKREEWARQQQPEMFKNGGAV